MSPGWKRHTDAHNPVPWSPRKPPNTKSLSQYTQTTSNLHSHTNNHTQVILSTHILQSTHRQPAFWPPRVVLQGVPRHLYRSSFCLQGLRSQKATQTHTSHAQSHTANPDTYAQSHSPLEFNYIPRIHYTRPHRAPVGLLSPTQTHTDSPNVPHVSPATHPLPHPEPCAPIHASA